METIGKIILALVVVFIVLIITSLMLHARVDPLWCALIVIVLVTFYLARKIIRKTPDPENESSKSEDMKSSHTFQTNSGSDEVERATQAILSTFSPDPSIRREQLRQFLREEADAARQGNETAQKFAKTLFPDPEQYKGAMREDAKYPVDGPGGPQQTLLRYVMGLRNDPEKMVKFRCEVVGNIQKIYKSGE